MVKLYLLYYFVQDYDHVEFEIFPQLHRSEDEAKKKAHELAQANKDYWDRYKELEKRNRRVAEEWVAKYDHAIKECCDQGGRLMYTKAAAALSKFWEESSTFNRMNLYDREKIKEFPEFEEFEEKWPHKYHYHTHGLMTMELCVAREEVGEMTQEEAEKAFKDAPEVPITEKELNKIISYVRRRTAEKQ
jgi:hypothetical protein